MPESVFGGESGSPVHVATRALTNAQIKQLPTNPAVFAPAPRDGWYLDFVHATLVTFMNADTPYVGGSEVGFGYWDGVSFFSGYVSYQHERSAVLPSSLAGYRLTSTFVPLHSPQVGPLNHDYWSGFSLALSIGLGVNLTGGDDGNTLNGSLLFNVVDLATGAYLTPAQTGWNQTTRTFTA